MSTQLPEKVNVLGVGISAVTMETAIQTIERWIQTKDETRYVCVTELHGLMESQRHESIRLVYNRADMVVPDGMAVVWAMHWLGYKWVERVYGPDLMMALCERSVKTGCRHFLYGGAPGVPELLAHRLRNRFPGLNIVGTYSPPFRPLTPQEDAEVVAMIHQARPDIVWIGLSTPKQEQWMAEHADRLQNVVMIGVGAAFDFHAGIKRRAPRWMQKRGLEWFFRLMQEPRRLWKRYLPNIPLFFWLLALQKMGIRYIPLHDEQAKEV
ncbi:MAG TPA: WecB/TagA/CpsF family glycosyltransferase [Anaerolineae bacterium]|nr:WecB/TagA/CpsF family glycosyltransferase [Anaerolineae bacterium]